LASRQGGTKRVESAAAVASAATRHGFGTVGGAVLVVPGGRLGDTEGVAVACFALALEMTSSRLMTAHPRHYDIFAVVECLVHWWPETPPVAAAGRTEPVGGVEKGR